MTCIAWDGKTLAVDKRVIYCGLARTVTKIFRIRDSLVGIAGDGAQGMDMVEWYRAGCDVEKFPIAQRDKDQWATVVVVKPDGLWLYERTPVMMRIEDAIYATGSGRDYALAAMHLGKSAAEAVEIACLFDIGCGNGVDTLELDDRIVALHAKVSGG